jgi:hypothetical protein
MDNALLELERKIEIELRGIVPFSLRSRLTYNFQEKVCSNITFNDNDWLKVDFGGYSLAEMVSVLLWVQSKKLKLRRTERHSSTYVTTWYHNAPEPALKYERERDPCPLLITLTNRSQFCYISNYSGYHPQPGNCTLRELDKVRFSYFRPNKIHERISLPEFESDWYKLHLAMEIVRRKGETAQLCDTYFDLPVAVGIVMATKLVRMKHNDPMVNLAILHEFVYNTGPATYHIFSGDNRKLKFRVLTRK